MCQIVEHAFVQDAHAQSLASISETLTVGTVLAVANPQITSTGPDSWMMYGNTTLNTELFTFHGDVHLPNRTPRDDAKKALILSVLIDRKAVKNDKENVLDAAKAMGFSCTCDGLVEACNSDNLPLVLLENVAVAYQRLGQEDAALLYALAAWRMSWITPRSRSVILATALLHKRGRVLGAANVALQVRSLDLFIAGRVATIEPKSFTA